jgi:hypothetical protein
MVPSHKGTEVPIKVLKMAPKGIAGGMGGMSYLALGFCYKCDGF